MGSLGVGHVPWRWASLTSTCMNDDNVAVAVVVVAIVVIVVEVLDAAAAAADDAAIWGVWGLATFPGDVHH